jgi:hypothetical protein
LKQILYNSWFGDIYVGISCDELFEHIRKIHHDRIHNHGADILQGFLQMFAKCEQEI